MITQNEFEEKIKNSKFIEDPQELIDYRFPVVEYYLKHIANRSATKITPTGIIGLKTSNIILNKPEVNDHINFTALNIAFDGIVKTMMKKWETPKK